VREQMPSTRQVFLLCRASSGVFTLNIQGGPKVTLPEKILNISTTAPANELIFFLNDRDMFKLHINKDNRGEPCPRVRSFSSLFTR